MPEFGPPPETLTIEVKEAALHITGGQHGIRILHPDGEGRQLPSPDGSLVETRCEWRGDRLVVESTRGDGSALTEVFALAPGNRLVATTKLQPRGVSEAIYIHQYYELAGEKPTS